MSESEMKIKYHPAAELLPMMSADELRTLGADIRERGQLHPCVIFDGLLLDGRNRWEACALVGVTPIVETLDACESPAAYVMSANVERRHLNTGQRSLLAASPGVLAAFSAEAKARMLAGVHPPPQSGGGSDPRARRQATRDNEALARAAKAAGVGRANAYSMQKIAREAPEVAERVRRGEITSVAEATREAFGVPARPTPTPPPPRSSSRPGRPRAVQDDKVMELIALKHPQAEVARMLNMTPSLVSQCVKRNTTKNPVASLTAYIDEAADSFATWESEFRPEWATASLGQLDELTERVKAMVAAARSFTQRLKKEAQRDQ